MPPLHSTVQPRNTASRAMHDESRWVSVVAQRRVDRITMRRAPCHDWGRDASRLSALRGGFKIKYNNKKSRNICDGRQQGTYRNSKSPGRISMSPVRCWAGRGPRWFSVEGCQMNAAGTEPKGRACSPFYSDIRSEGLISRLRQATADHEI